METVTPVSAMLSMTASLGNPPLIGPLAPLIFRMSHGPQMNGAVMEKRTVTTTKMITGMASEGMSGGFWMALMAERIAAWLSLLGADQFSMALELQGELWLYEFQVSLVESRLPPMVCPEMARAM